MTITRIHTFLFALLLALSLPVAAQPIPDDVHLERQVAHLLNAQPALRNIHASAEGGVITLSGQVLEPEQRKAAADIAGGISGVKEVDNEITLDPDLSAFGQTRLAEHQILRCDDLYAKNTFDRPDRVAPETLTASDLTLPPLSWNRITFDIL